MTTSSEAFLVPVEINSNVVLNETVVMANEANKTAGIYHVGILHGAS